MLHILSKLSLNNENSKAPVFTGMQPPLYMKIFKSNIKLIDFTSLPSYDDAVTGTENSDMEVKTYEFR